MVETTGLIVTSFVLAVVFAISIVGVSNMLESDASISITISGGEILGEPFEVEVDSNNIRTWIWCSKEQSLEFADDGTMMCINNAEDSTFQTKELPEGVYSKCWTSEELHLIPEGREYCGEFKAYDEEREFYYAMVDELMIEKIEEMLGE